MRRVSVVVRTRDSGPALHAVLTDLTSQVGVITEFIIVDNTSRDATRAVADQFSCKWIDYPSAQEFNYSKAINVGVAKASGEYVLICSPHIRIPQRDTVLAMIDALAVLNLSAVYCELGDWPVHDTHERSVSCETICWNNYDGTNALRNYFALYSRQLLMETGGFDETLPCCEDQKWALDQYSATGVGTGRIDSHRIIYMNPRLTLWKRARDFFVVYNMIAPGNGVQFSRRRQLRRMLRYFGSGHMDIGLAMMTAIGMSLWPSFFRHRLRSRYY
jgi:glycosyltransferase involved in cell wall biosynthesis